MAEVHRRAADIVAHLPEVRAAVRDAADQVAQRARATLAAHRDTGTAAIETTRGRTDTTVSLVDDAALSIEYGHHAPDGTPIRGLRVLRDAADL
ncbi:MULTISPECIES: DUF5403 family protein [Actinokineospora]|uniref:HK97 gp10 family phage protein n=1 Tax=Actinokineospora cianjurensis TaxID=585224 RepID=A0A421AYF7_9PSEU|nr:MULTISPECIES: DUF5403 family protein [Actinokineospora]MBM7771236.1 hypothetical protein [Actinokineospora baliensis]RLK54825.1 hypothetical protein CLV68_5213 [Actinokineospora cianjurensis]